MAKDKLPRIPSFAELGIDDDEIEELEREIAEEAAARKRREAGKGEPAEKGAPGGGTEAVQPPPPRAKKVRRGRRRRASAASAIPAASAKPSRDAPVRPGAAPAQTGAVAAADSEERKDAPIFGQSRRKRRTARKAKRLNRKKARGEAKAARRKERAAAREAASESAPQGRRALWGGLRGPATLVALVTAGWFSSSHNAIPSPVPASAPDSVFSSGRAMAHLDRIAAEARPTGSPAHARVREYLIGELRELGLEPEVQTATAFEAAESVTRAATVRNVAARMPGAEPGGRAVLATAHYDGAGISLAAGDDGSGVAAILEAVRALGAGGPLRNDLIVLFTDGEELGLLGARAFVERHSWLEDVALVISVEMRGGGGPSMMFETGPGNGWVIDAMRRADPYPAANSVSYEVYRRMHNRTDFTPFVEAGKQGLNFAAVGRSNVYHQAYDSPGNLSEATVQHHGEHVLAMLRHFGDAELGTLEAPASVDAPDVSFFTLPFLGLVSYGKAWTWLLGLVCAGAWALLFWLCRRRGARAWAMAVGLVGSAVHVALAGAAAFYLVAWRAGAHPELGALVGRAFHVEGWHVLAILCVAFAFAAAAAGVMRRWLTAAELAVGAVALPTALAVAATVWLPMGALNIQWPALAACLGALALMGMERERPVGFLRWLPALLAAVPVVVVMTPLTQAVWSAMGLQWAAAVSVMFSLGLLMAAPALDAVREPNPLWAPLGALMAGGAFLAVGMWMAAPSADRPAPSTLVYALDHETGAAFWGTDPSRGEQDPGVAWATRAFGSFGAAGGRFGDEAGPDSLSSLSAQGISYALAEADPVGVRPPSVALLDGGGGSGDTFRLVVRSDIGAEMMLFDFNNARARLLSVNGRDLEPGALYSRVEHWGMRDGGVELRFNRVPGEDLMHFTVVEHHLRPGELLGAEVFRRPPELAPNVRMQSDRAMFRTAVSVNPRTGEVRMEGGAAGAGLEAGGAQEEDAAGEGGAAEEGAAGEAPPPPQ